MKNVGENIRLLRLRLGIGQKSLARQVGCTQAHISGIEHGKDLSISLLLKISQALGCNVTDIIE